MTENIIQFPGTTTVDLDPDEVLEASKGQLERFILVGYTKDTGDYWFAATHGDNEKNNWLLDKFKQFLLNLEAEE
jgi:hypothetical protein